MNRQANLLLAFLAAFFSVEVHKASAQSAIHEYVIIDFGAFSAQAINNKGQIVGTIVTTDGKQHVAIYADGVVQDIGNFTDSFVITPYGISDDGRVVGTYFNGAIQRAFLYSQGSLRVIPTLGGVENTAQGINGKGQVVGGSGGSWENGDSDWHAFVYSGGVSAQDLGVIGNGKYSYASAINAVGQVVGWVSTNPSPSDVHAFLYSGSELKDVGTFGGSSFALGINVKGQVVGYSYVQGSSRSRAFLYSGDSFIDLGTLGNGFNSNSEAVGINDNSQVVGTSNDRAFLYEGGAMRDLNGSVVNPVAGSVLNRGLGINNAGAIIARLAPSKSVLLTPLPLGWRETIEAQPAQRTYGESPTKELGKQNLILVTHGWTPRHQDINSPPNPAWIDNMSNALSGYLDNNPELAGWQVYGHKWVEKSWKWFPDDALENGNEEGRKLGERLASDSWSHIHFIAHSAGSALIQAATEVIKDTPGNTTTIHETFLDPYVGLEKTGVASYGYLADWSDHYLARDRLTGVWQLTQSSLERCYNVDVTYLDPNKLQVDGFISTSGGVSEPCKQTKTSHDWPIDFYLNTIVGTVPMEYEGFGFPLSKEGGNWDYARANYGTPNDPPHPLGNADPPCTEYLSVTTPAVIGPTVNFMESPTAGQSPTGTIQKWPFGFQEFPGSPVWFSSVITLTNPVNTVSFESVFVNTNVGSEGMLSVYWNSNTIGSIDERAVKPGLQRYSFHFPNANANSSHVLGFRLDPFTNALSSVIVTNVVLSQVGVSEPFELLFTTNTSAGLRILKLLGQPGFTYTVEASTNLINWMTIATLANTSGVVQFIDMASTNQSQRFYRALAP